MLTEVCWWSRKVSEYEAEAPNEPEETEGHSESGMPLNILSSSETDSDDEVEAQPKKSRPSTSQALAPTNSSFQNFYFFNEFQLFFHINPF